MELENFDEKKMNVEMTGFIENGKQFDIEVKVPKDNRNVAFGIVKDEYGDVIPDAVVKLIEVEKMMGKEDRKPVSHTFTNENGEFVFGPLCPDRSYELQIWVDRVKHIKICHVVNPKRSHCLKGVKAECKKHEMGCGPALPKPEPENPGCPMLDM
jgi:hypothetical protein